MNNFNIDFDQFDENIGVSGYDKIIADSIFGKNRSSDKFNLGTIKGVSALAFPVSEYFCRTRIIPEADAERFKYKKLIINEFLPPPINACRKGRFNAEKERVLYLADNPQVAVKETSIQPGDYFVLSYFKLNKILNILRINNGSDNTANLLFSLLHAKDPKFYDVTHLIFSKYLEFLIENEPFAGIAYSSVKNYDVTSKNIPEKTLSTLNLAVKSPFFSHFDFIGSIFIQYSDDENFHFRNDGISFFHPRETSKTKKNKVILKTSSRNEFNKALDKFDLKLEALKKDSQANLKVMIQDPSYDKTPFIHNAIKHLI